ncbi:hypothetical protein F5Y09DRAFT_347580 [Xylaria sp. FL1042]|nr:hypothetical protein F5Y09DRAFT_347580 [Xylaria sp. FL1042]
MHQHQPPEISYVPLVSLKPLHTLNAFRASLGLGPSENLISSAIDAKENQLENSPAYQGDISLRRNICAPIPDELNCRLWITGLPKGCTVHKLLRCIRGIGPIFACHITRANPTGAKAWDTAAASLTFFTADAANYFLGQDAINPFTVEGHRTRIVRHRIRTESVCVGGRSRVLQIVGDADVVRPGYLQRVIAEEWKIRFDTDFVRFCADEGRGVNEIIWAFGSFRAQAHIICMKINKKFGGRARAIYISDPCVREGY